MLFKVLEKKGHQKKNHNYEAGIGDLKQFFRKIMVILINQYRWANQVIPAGLVNLLNYLTLADAIKT